MSEPSRFPFHKTYYHPTRGAKTDALASVFWPVVMFLLSVSVSLICWGAYNALPQPASAGEKPLRQAVLPPKFNPDSARVPPGKKAEPVAESELHARAKAASEPPLLPPLPMTMPVLPPAEPIILTALEPPPLPTQITAVNPLVYRESTPGDTPMLRNWKTLALCSLLTSAVLVQAPVLADEKAVLDRMDKMQESIKTSFEGVTKDMGELKIDFKKIRDSIDDLENKGVQDRLKVSKINSKVEQLEAAFEKLRGEIETLRREPTVAKTGIDKGSVEDIKTKLGSIEQAILRLQPSTSRVAMSPPTASAMGRVVLVNLYPEELLYLINGKTFRVAPGNNMPVDNVPAGTLNYEVISGTWGSRAKNTTTLAPNETFTLTAR